MRSIDTNIVVRFLARDDDAQAKASESLIVKGVFIPDTVLIEAEWVLRRAYDWSRERVNEALVALIAVEPVHVASPDGLYWALDRHRRGADWADMLHLLASAGHSAFATFDRALAKSAGPESPLPVETLK